MVEFDRFAVGIVIKKLRKEKGLSQEVLSGLAGLARSHLTMIERGDKKANFETLWRISNALEMKPHQVVKLIEDETENRRKTKWFFKTENACRC